MVYFRLLSLDVAMGDEDMERECLFEKTYQPIKNFGRNGDQMG